MLDLFYTGLPRFVDRTRDNHARMIDHLREKFGEVRIHDFLQPAFDRSDCPVTGDLGSAGGLQVWDFMKAAQRLSAPCLVKLRTDLWFSNSSVAALIDSIDRCLAGTIDVGYLGANVKMGFDQPQDRKPADHDKKVPDFVIVARRTAVLDIQRVRSQLESAGDVASGNRVFKIITPDLSRSETTWCRIFLVRRERTYPRDWNMAWDFIKSYPQATLAGDFLATCRPDQPL